MAATNEPSSLVGDKRSSVLQHETPASVLPETKEIPTIYRQSSKPKTLPFTPSSIIDGSKLILRLVKNDQFVYDAPCRILLASPNLKFDRRVTWQTMATCTEAENTICIDANLSGHRFIPIPLSYFGTVYTKSGTIHITVGSSVKRAKVYSRNLPYAACNKFEAASENLDGALEWFVDHLSTSRALSHVDSEHVAKTIKHLASDPHDGMLYIRADDSLLRYQLKNGDRVALMGGAVVAWTLGVRFEVTSYCCFRTVAAVHGEGTIWVQNARTVAGRSLAAAGGAF